MFLIFIPLFLLIPCVVVWMDWSLQAMARGEKYGWEPTRPDFGLTRVRHTGFTSHMRAIQKSPRYTAMRRNRPQVSGHIRRITHA